MLVIELRDKRMPLCLYAQGVALVWCYVPTGSTVSTGRSRFTTPNVGCQRRRHSPGGGKSGIMAQTPQAFRRGRTHLNGLKSDRRFGLEGRGAVRVFSCCSVYRIKRGLSFNQPSFRR